MIHTARTLVVGLGSAHGDDQAGWRVSDLLAARCRMSADVSVRTASVPLDLLDWLDDVEVLHVCDACECGPAASEVLRLEWRGGRELTDNPDGPARTQLKLRTGRGSHDFGLPEVLKLAQALNRLPGQVIIWAVPGTQFDPGQECSPDVCHHLCKAADAILKELSAAEPDAAGRSVR